MVAAAGGYTAYGSIRRPTTVRVAVTSPHPRELFQRRGGVLVGCGRRQVSSSEPLSRRLWAKPGQGRAEPEPWRMVTALHRAAGMRLRRMACVYTAEGTLSRKFGLMQVSVSTRGNRPAG